MNYNHPDDEDGVDVFSPSVVTALSLSGNFHCGRTPLTSIRPLSPPTDLQHGNKTILLWSGRPIALHCCMESGLHK